MVLASQHSRRIFVEKTFDTQEFQIKRQADLIGQSVTQAVSTNAPTPRIDGKSWVEAVPQKQPQTSWQEAVTSPATEAAAAPRLH